MSIARAQSIRLAVVNRTGATIPKNALVAPVGIDEQTGHLKIALADRDDPERRPAIGFTRNDMRNDSTTQIVRFGIVRGLNTEGMTSENQQVMLGRNGEIQREPVDPSFIAGADQFVGTVVVSHKTEGAIVASFGRTIFSVDGYDSEEEWDGTKLLRRTWVRADGSKVREVLFAYGGQGNKDLVGEKLTLYRADGSVEEQKTWAHTRETVKGKLVVRRKAEVLK